MINLIENSTLSNISIIITPEGGGGSTSECSTNEFETSYLEYGETSDFKNITLGRYKFL